MLSSLYVCRQPTNIHTTCYSEQKCGYIFFWITLDKFHKPKSKIPKDLNILWNSQPKWGQQGFTSQGSQTQLTLTLFRFASIRFYMILSWRRNDAIHRRYILQVQKRTENWTNPPLQPSPPEFLPTYVITIVFFFTLLFSLNFVFRPVEVAVIIAMCSSSYYTLGGI